MKYATTEDHERRRADGMWDEFDVEELIDSVKAYCREHSMEMARFWIFPPDEVYMFYGISMHLAGEDRWVEYDANVLFVLKDLSEMDNREVEEGRLRCIFEDLGEPIVLTSKVAKRPAQQRQFFKRVGLTKIPVTWSDHRQNVYEVYTKGHIEMGGFVNLMERVEFIGKEIVYW